MNLKLFKKRVIAFYSSWNKYKKELWGNSDLLVIYTPPEITNGSHPISSHFFIWLLGHDFPDTIAVFTSTAIYFLCTKKKVPILQTLTGPAIEALKAPVFVHRKDICDDGPAWVDNIIHGVRNTNDGENHKPLVIGCISGEYLKSKLIWTASNFNSKSTPAKYECARVNSGLIKLINYGDTVFRGLKTSRGIQVQMHCLPAKFEEMLSMTADVLPAKDGEGEVLGEDEMLNEDVLVCDEKGIQSMFEEDWVLVEADEKE